MASEAQMLEAAARFSDSCEVRTQLVVRGGWTCFEAEIKINLSEIGRKIK